MAVESADDRAAFVNPDEFGEAIRYNGVSGFSAIWDRPTTTASFGDSRLVLPSNVFTISVAAVVAPEIGDTIEVDRTSQTFQISQEPELNEDGSFWACGAEPA